MTTMHGADVGALRSLAAQFDRAAGQLDQNRMAVGNAIQISAWIGPFAVRFRIQWNSEHSMRIHDAAQLLREGAHALRRNANEQERASAADGGIGYAPYAPPRDIRLTLAMAKMDDIPRGAIVRPS